MALGMAAQEGNLPAQDYTVTADVQYCTGGGKPLLMDVFLPRKPLRTPTPAVLWLHGGGWERGDKNGSSGARFLAAAGFVTASIYYRLSGDAKFPAAIEDCKCAIRYLRANASKYGIDPQKMGVAGASAGAHLALLAGFAGKDAGLEGSGGWPDTSSEVSAISSFYGPTDFRNFTEEFGERGRAAIAKFLGDDPKASVKASPIVYLSETSPPILMVHGDSDELVPFEQSRRLLDACNRAGVSARLIRVGNAGHDFAPHDPAQPLSISIERIQEITIDFFKAQLLP